METQTKNTFSLDEILGKNSINTNFKIDVPGELFNEETKKSFIGKLTERLSYFFQPSVQRGQTEMVYSLEKELQNLQNDRDFLGRKLNSKISQLKESLLDELQEGLKKIETNEINPIYKEVISSGIVIDSVIDDKAMNKIRDGKKRQIESVKSRMDKIRRKDFDSIKCDERIQKQARRVNSDFNQKVKLIDEKIESIKKKVDSLKRYSNIEQSLFEGAEKLKNKGIEADYLVPTDFIKEVEKRDEFYHLEPNNEGKVDVYFDKSLFYKKLEFDLFLKKWNSDPSDESSNFKYDFMYRVLLLIAIPITAMVMFILHSLGFGFAFSILLPFIAYFVVVPFTCAWIGPHVEKKVSKKRLYKCLKSVIGGRLKRESIGKLRIQTPPLHDKVLKNRLKMIHKLGIKTYLLAHKKGFSFDEDNLTSILEKKEVRRQAKLRRQRILAMDPIICHDLGKINEIEITAVVGSYGDVPEEQKVIDEIIEQFGKSHFYMNTPVLNLN